MITKAMVAERLEALKRDRQALANRMTAVEGAIMDCEYWLQQIDKAAAADGAKEAST